jgi:hypothetical protein
LRRPGLPKRDRPIPASHAIARHILHFPKAAGPLHDLLLALDGILMIFVSNKVTTLMTASIISPGVPSREF